MLGTRRHVCRCLLVWATGTAALAAVAVAAGPPAVEGATAARAGTLDLLPLDRALSDLAAAVAVGCAVWGWLLLSLTVVEAVGGGDPPARRRGAACRVPRGVRRLVLAACGVTIMSATAPASLADDGAHALVHRAALLSGLPLPDRAVAPTASTPPAAARSQAGHSSRTVVVSPGDTLWSIAVEQLPAASSDRRINTWWHRVYAANRALIGPDPDVIQPGQHLDLFPEQPPGKDRK